MEVQKAARREKATGVQMRKHVTTGPAVEDQFARVAERVAGKPSPGLRPSSPSGRGFQMTFSLWEKVPEGRMRADVHIIRGDPRLTWPFHLPTYA